MDANIILQGRQPNVLAQMDAGTIAAQRQYDFGRQQQYDQLSQQYGPGIMAGEQNALNALAQFDPVAGMNMRATQQGLQIDQEQLSIMRDEAARQAQEWARTVSADEVAAEREQARQMLTPMAPAVLKAIQGDPTELEALAQENGMEADDLLGMFMAMDGAIEALDGMKGLMPKPAAPMSTPGKVWSDVAAGFLTPEQGATAMQPKPGVVVNTGENSNAFNKKSDELAAQRFSDIVSDGLGAQRMAGDLSALAEIAKNLETGLPAQVTALLGPYAEVAGVSIDSLGPAQAYEAIAARLAPSLRTPGVGSSSDLDAKQFLLSIPSLGKTPEGNAIISATLNAIVQHKIAASEIAQKAQRGEMTWQEADAAMSRLGNPFDAFNTFKGKGKSDGGLSQEDIDFMNGGGQ